MTPAMPAFSLLPDFGGGEMLILMFVVLLLFGGDKMPQLAKGIAKSLREFKKAAGEVEREIKQAIDEVPETPRVTLPDREIPKTFPTHPPARPSAPPDPGATPNS